MDNGFTLQDFTNLIIAGSAALTAIYACRGLYAWRDKMKGETEYELAKRLIKEIILIKKQLLIIDHGPTCFQVDDDFDVNNHVKIEFLVYDWLQPKIESVTEALSNVEAEIFIEWGKDKARLTEPFSETINDIVYGEIPYKLFHGDEKISVIESDGALIIKNDFHFSGYENSKKFNENLSEKVNIFSDAMRPYIDPKNK